jgi:hypothetical protein
MSISRYSTPRAIVKEYQADVVAVAFGKKPTMTGSLRRAELKKRYSLM